MLTLLLSDVVIRDSTLRRSDSCVAPVSLSCFRGKSHPRVALVHARLLQRKQLAQPDRAAVHERPAAPVGIDGDRPARTHLQAEEKKLRKKYRTAGRRERT